MRVPARLLFLAPLLAGLLSCELSTGLISETERRSIYTLGFMVGGVEVEDDVAAESGDPVQVSLTPLRGAETAGALFLSLNDASGEAVAALSYLSAVGRSAGLLAEGDEEAAMSVEKLDGILPRFSLPPGLKPGSYVLKARLVGSSGSTFQESAIQIHVAPRGFASGELSIYPPAPSPGSPVLLSIDPQIVRGPDPNTDAAYYLASEARLEALSEGEVPVDPTVSIYDPWIRWSSGSQLISEGRLSDGADRVAWVSPPAEGAYGVAVDIFPDPPQDRPGLPSVSPWRVETKIVAELQSKPTASVFAVASRFHLLYSFDSVLENRGSGSGAEALRPIGRPRLEAFSGGFGYRLGVASGFKMEGAVWPSVAAGERLVLFLRLSPDRLAGVLAEFSEPGAGFVLRLGIDDGRPYVESALESGSAFRSVAAMDLPPGPLELQLELRESEDGLSPLWTASPAGRGPARKARSTPLPGLNWASLSNGAVLSLGGGAQSLPGVYDEFGILADAAPPSLFGAAYQDRFDERLLAAADFAEGKSGIKTLSLVDGSGFAAGALRLEAGASASLPLGLDPATEYEIVVDLGRSVRAGLRLGFFDESGTSVLRIYPDGSVKDAFGKMLGVVGRAEADRLALRLRPAEEGWRLSSAAAALDLPSVPAIAGIRLSAQGSGGAEGGYVEILALAVVGDPDRGLVAAPQSQLGLR